MSAKKYFIVLFTLLFVVSCTVDDDNDDSGGGSVVLGDGGGVNVKDDGTGYYEYAKFFTGFGNVTTNEKPVVSWLSPDKTDKNSIRNSIGYRIPSMITLPTGRIVISGDIRWTGNGDTPHKTDTFSRYSDDHGKTWSKITILQKYDDMDTNTFSKVINAGSGTDKSEGQLKVAAGIADTAIGRAKDGTLIAIGQASPHSVGGSDGAWGVRSGRAYKEIEGVQHLMLREEGDYDLDDFSISADGAQSQGSTKETVEADDRTEFKYGFNAEEGGQLKLFEFKEDGQTPDSYTFVEDVYIDKQFFIWTDSAMKVPLMVAKLAVTAARGYEWSDDNETQAQLFYLSSPYWPFRVFTFTVMTRSFDDGVTWEDRPTIISHFIRKGIDSQPQFTALLNVSPTAGYLKRFGADKDRLFFSAYTTGSAQNSTRPEVPFVFWTDDDGDTWDAMDDWMTIGGGGVSAFSETAIVEAPNGDLISISRAQGVQAAVYATSKDSGENWSPAIPIPNGPDALNMIAYNQISAINLSLWKGVNGEPLVAFANATMASRRRNGTVTLAALKVNNDIPQGWEFEFTTAFAGSSKNILYTDNLSNHDYSAVVEDIAGNLGVYYEGNQTFAGGAGGHHLDAVTIDMYGI